MVENGAFGVIFAIWSLWATNWEDPFARSLGPREFAVSYGQTYAFEQQNSRELRVSWFSAQRIGAVQMAYDLSLTDKGGLYAGAGGRLRHGFELGGVPAYVGVTSFIGYWDRGNDRDLGFPIEFRTGLELGVELGESWRVGIVSDHRSNMRLPVLFEDGEINNSGLESIQLRITREF